MIVNISLLEIFRAKQLAITKYFIALHINVRTSSSTAYKGIKTVTRNNFCNSTTCHDGTALVPLFTANHFHL